MTLRWAQALELGDAEFERDFGIRVVPGWAGFPETTSMLVRYARSGCPPTWGPQLVFDEDGALVGNGGWKGEPVDGAAELGYAIAPTRQNRGIATALVNHLLTTARDAGVTIAVAHTLAAESASTRVLRKSGFHRCGQLIDPDNGPVWRWEHQITQATMPERRASPE